jgi:hypothetical protein
MKRCPECNSLFPETEKFCELDGATLNDEIDEESREPESARATSNSLIPIAATGGLIIGVLLVLVFLVLTHDKVQNPPSASTAPTPNANQQRLASRPPESRPLAVESPSEEPSPSPSPEPSPSIQPSPEQIKLSTSPISTTQGNSGPVTIRLQGGNSIDADEAWQTKEGIWYRKGGMVALLDPKDVKSVEKRTVR